MKIAIHHRLGSFSDRWIAYCEQQNIPFKVVNAFDSNIIEQVKNCDVFMWPHHHAQYKDVLTAKRILFALEHAGVRVFPDFKTGWHFDDKVAQKYLLEAIDAPLVPSYVFYDKQEALQWANTTSYPKVFKLKGGAGAANVSLINSKKEALKTINKAFGKGYAQFDRLGNLKDSYNNYIHGSGSFLSVLKGFVRLAISTDFAKQMAPEKGYVYFQDFIPNNNTDFRIKVVGDKCWGFQRKVRPDDFRASGSGQLLFDNSQIPIKMIEIAFDVAKKAGMQSVAFDFVIGQAMEPLIVEVSYGFGIDDDEFDYGFWDSDLNWHEDTFNPLDIIVRDLVKGISNK